MGELLLRKKLFAPPKQHINSACSAMFGQCRTESEHGRRISQPSIHLGLEDRTTFFRFMTFTMYDTNTLYIGAGCRLEKIMELFTGFGNGVAMQIQRGLYGEFTAFESACLAVLQAGVGKEQTFFRGDIGYVFMSDKSRCIAGVNRAGLRGLLSAFECEPWFIVHHAISVW